MGVTLTDVLLFGKAQSDDVDNATLVIYRRNILRWSTIGGYLDIIVKGVAPLSLPDAIADSLSYVKAFGGTEQRNIPQPYTQVNYVTNTAQTAVNTGILIDFAKNYEFEVECRAVSGSWYILQSRASSSGNITGIHGATSGSTITLVVGNVTVCTSAITRTVGNKLYVKATLNAGTATLYVKDETANTEDTQTGSYGTSQPNPTAAVYLLGNAGGQYVDVNSDIYMARIKENDTVVMDYVPARQVATAGFYDKASGTFKTALTPANLSADGNTVPTPDAPMDIVSNNGVLKARHGYTLLEYIESSGTQYIDTGFSPDANTRVDWQGQLISGSSGVLLGARVGNSNPGRFFPFAFSIGTNYRTTYGDHVVNVSADTSTVCTGSFRPSESKSIINGTTYSFVSSNFSKTESNNLLLFGVSGYGDQHYLSTGKIWYVKIWDNNSIVRNLVPAKNSSGVVGMYDTVSGQFFTNAGTGDFIAGDPVSDLVEVYTDGTVETIKDSLNNTATAEMLLKVGDYQDEQEILSGAVTRNVGILVLDGTEPWAEQGTGGVRFQTTIYDMLNQGRWTDKYDGLCSHFQTQTAYASQTTQGIGWYMYQDRMRIIAYWPSGADSFRAWLADQYAAGTPVIIIYLLATPTTESVTGQTLQVTSGDNILEITQASLDGLELEAEYSAAVSLTIQEVQDANLDNNVEVTIS